jgi:L-alanine-DL-glutamate epimerase-like enolase superfamily enzyme
MKYKNCLITYKDKKFNLKNQFKISRGSKSSINTLQIRIKKNDLIGRGECVPYKRYGDNLKKIKTFLKQKTNINNLKSIKILSLRNAISNAYLDLNLKEKKIAFQKYLKKAKYKTAITIPIFKLKKFINEIKKYKNVEILKIKLNQKNIFNYLDVVKKYSPKSKIVIDANEGWSLSFLKKNELKIKTYNILFIEQPVKSGKDYYIKTSLDLCADESFHLSKR